MILVVIEFMWLFLQAHSITSNFDTKSMIESGISYLNQTDFSRQSDLNFLYSFHYNLTRGNFSENQNCFHIFSGNGGIEVLNDWLDRFVNCNSNGDDNTLLLKSFSGRAVWIVGNGLYHGAFCHEKLLMKVVSFMLTPLLFLDSDFTSDMFIAGVFIINEFKKCSARFGLKSILKRLLVPQRLAIEKRFKLEKSITAKLSIASILAPTFSNDLNYEQLEIFHIDISQLLLTRNLILSRVASETSLVPFKTEFAPTWIWNTVDFARYFNFVLLAPSNRKQLCDKQTFKYLFANVDRYADLKTEQHSCLHSLRGIFILCQNCPNFKEFFTRSDRSRKQSKLTRKCSINCFYLRAGKALIGARISRIRIYQGRISAHLASLG